MRFELRHRFNCDPDTLWSITESDEFEKRLAAASTSTRELVERTEKNGEVFICRRIVAKRTLPAPMQKAIGSEHIGWDQHTWRKVGTNVLRWKIVPMVIRDRFSGEGTTTLRPTGDGCERVINGELTIRIPLIGGAMEKKLVEDVSASYEHAARIASEILRERAASK
jgi:hypothetical protein